MSHGNRVYPGRKYDQLSTVNLLEEYYAAVSSFHGRMTNYSPRDKRINLIVDLLSERADHGDTAALNWFEKD